jgi:hypothetical protein
MVVERASAIEDCARVYGWAGKGYVATLVIANPWVVEVESADWLKCYVATW